jgi:uncharacterized membrane protein
VKIVTFLFLFFNLVACNYNRVHGEAPDKAAKLEEMSAASFDYASVQFAVISPKCLNCHSASGGNKGGLNLETYPQVRANMNRIYFRAIEKRDMPAEGLPQASFDLLKSWLEAGAPEKNMGNAGPPIQGAVTWNVIRDRVLKSSCLDCHSGAKPDANLDLSSAEVVRKNITVIFDSTLIKQTMPLEPYPAMSESQKQALMKWISQGMPD